MSARTLVLVCTYNEVENLPELFEQLGHYLPRADILVVDDSSPDGTAAWVRAHPRYRTHTAASVDSAIYLIQRSGKHGLGTATREGLRWCLDRAYDYIINLDADLSHPPEYAPVLLAACQPAPATGSTAEPRATSGGTVSSDIAASGTLACDVAIGSRYVTGGSSPGLPGHRRWISRLLNVYANNLLRLPVKDCSGSYRCYRVDALRRIDLSQLNCPGYGFLEELLVALHRSGARIAEYPIEFRARSGGHSKLGLSDAWGAMRVIHKLAFSRR